jgi:two-component system sensor histidine kinase PilS (NtrC family)
MHDSGVRAVANAERAALQEKLEWLMLARLIVVTIILGSALAFNITESKSLSSPEYLGLTGLIILTYLATLGYVAWVRLGYDLGRLSLIQLLADVFVVAGVISLTGGVESIFTFLFLLIIFSGANVQGRRGAIMVASASSIALGMVATVQFTAAPWLVELLPVLRLHGERVPVYVMLVHLVAFYSVAFLSGYLTEKLGQVGSELERRQLDLRALRALNDDIIRSVDSGLIALDDRGRILFANEAADKITGQPLTAMVFHRLSDRLPQLMGAAERLLTSGERYRESLALPQSDHTMRFVALSLSPLRNAVGDPSGFILLLEDVTEIRELQEVVSRQQQLATLGNLAAAIAHEIRNPLAAISGSTEMLRMSAKLDDEDGQLLEIVLREVDRLNGLIKEFLDYARPRSIHLRRTDITQLVREIVVLFSQDTSVVQQTVLAIHADGVDQSWVFLDPDRIRQVLWNLLRNACEACGPSGQVDIRVSGSRLDRVPAVTVVIEDNGPGMPAGVIEKVFEPFFTTKTAGTGLGLATSHRVVGEHGGMLRAQNRAEGGARFMLTLPVDVRTSRERTDSFPATTAELALPETRSAPDQT